VVVVGVVVVVVVGIVAVVVVGVVVVVVVGIVAVVVVGIVAVVVASIVVVIVLVFTAGDVFIPVPNNTHGTVTSALVSLTGTETTLFNKSKRLLGFVVLLVDGVVDVVCSDFCVSL